MARLIEVINKGGPGNSTKDGLRLFADDVLVNKPDFLIIFFGFNDALWHPVKIMPVAEYKRNLQEMIDIAKLNGIKNIVLVTLYQIIPRYVRKRHPDHPEIDLNSHLDGFNRVIIEVAHKNRLDLADLRANECIESLVRDEHNSGAEDGVHLTPEGYKKMAGLIYGILKEKVKRGDKIVCFGDSVTYGVHVQGAGTTTGDTYPGRLYDLLNKKA